MIRLRELLCGRGACSASQGVPAVICGKLWQSCVVLQQNRDLRRRAGTGRYQQVEQQERQTERAPNENSEDILNLMNTNNDYSVETDDPQNRDDFLSDFARRKKQRLQQRYAYRPRADPKDTSILLFPGQGSQFVGMGKKLLQYPNVKKLYELSSEILGYDLLNLCLNGPKEKLDKTEFCQPAVFVTSLAALEKLRDDLPSVIDKCVATAGFSVGEYAALVFSGMLEFEDALNIVKLRGEQMQAASEAVAGGMMSVFCGAETQVGYACQVATEYCKKKRNIENPVCRIANYLCPEAKVVAGNIEALEFIKANAKIFGIRRMKMLPVSGAFHTDLMIDVKQPLKSALNNIQINKPLISVHNNVTAKRANQKSLVHHLVSQVYKPVKWEQTMHVLYSRDQGQSFPSTYELGPGKQLGTILRQINSKAFRTYKSVEV
ncbi:malonyl-CoA-acyl carrier protein transacylase, mitochondrial-like [Tubulanus polymorphus]|uniref:malonyl-CoA-acyl carrier protein transacylase, mitochondrial-like n=1 Tax=Tubulanus polymorphus TaxID=672921 RepID=UPI003DA20705